jgi:hypothetical protein
MKSPIFIIISLLHTIIKSQLVISNLIVDSLLAMDFTNYTFVFDTSKIINKNLNLSISITPPN